MWRREVRLTAEQRERVTWLVKQEPKPERRERAAAIVPVAAGKPAAPVAASGRLVQRDPDPVAGWLDRCEAPGVAGVTLAAGRGRTPTRCPPSAERSGGGAGRAAGDPGR